MDLIESGVFNHDILSRVSWIGTGTYDQFNFADSNLKKIIIKKNNGLLLLLLNNGLCCC